MSDRSRGDSRFPLGSFLLGEGRVSFRVWAPNCERVAVVRNPEGPFGRDGGERFALERDESGFHHAVLEGFPAGSRYMFELNSGDPNAVRRPDPASRLQADTVHGPSVIVDPAFGWTDSAWKGVDLATAVLYELHIGTFTPQGTFDAAIARLEELRDLGITAIEIMPVAQFPGTRNWGYDGVLPYAAQNSYGGPAGLKRLVNACHEKGIGVILDVVYNHIGPEGNYLSSFGPYFTDRYRTPWGEALNFDGPQCDPVRRFFIESALYWMNDCHIDGLRLDAIQMIQDFSALHLLEELRIETDELARRLGRPLRLIAESDLNDTKVIRPRSERGWGMDAQWSDDFHHSLHTVLTGEKSGYYADFGRLEDLEKSVREGFVYDWRHSVYRKRRHGSSSKDLPADRFVIYSQNHDQTGNRMLGERLSTLVSTDKLMLAAGMTLFTPGVPMLFMGEEYGETAPFQYFVSHGDPNLVEAVRRGRAEEFSSFRWKGTPPDPQDEETFHRSRLNHDLKAKEPHSGLLRFYREMIEIAKKLRSQGILSKENLETGLEPDSGLLTLQYPGHRFVFNFSPERHRLVSSDEVWYKVFESSQWSKSSDSAEYREIGPERFVYLIRK